MIELPEPFEQPAVPKKVYSEAWIKNIRINAPSPLEPIRFEATLVPYNPTTGEITDDGRFNIRCEDVTTAMQTNSALALTFSVIIDTINTLSKDPTMLNG